MRTEEIAFSHKDILYDKLWNVKTKVSEYTFANLFLFRREHQYKIIEDNGFFFVKGITYDGKSFVMPAFDPRKDGFGKLVELASSVDFIFPVPEEWLPLFDDSKFEKVSLEGDSDYLYSIEKMAEYPGHKLHKKRNLLKQFNENYLHEAFPLTNDRMKDAYAVLDMWQEETGESVEKTDYRACKEALDFYDPLVICGGIYYAENVPAGFILGQELDEETFALHFAKGLTKFKGIYQFIYNNFAKILPPKYHFLNFEQDLGIDTLRQAKSSYVPDLMIKKFRIKIK